MERSIYVGDKRYRVKSEEIEKGREFSITVNGKSHRVSLQVDPESGKLVEFVADNKPTRVNVLRRMGIDRIQISINGSVYSVSKSPTRPSLVSRVPVPLASRELARSARHEEGVLSAPTPGKIVLVRVKEGDFVEEGDALLILESMKMETTLKAHRSGTVGEIRVREGKSVSRGDVLLRLK